MLKKGFTLIEWLISFSLVLFIVISVFQMAATFTKNFCVISKKCDLCSELCAAFDSMVRNLYNAPCLQCNWKKIGEKEVVWHNDHKNIDEGWLFKNERLFSIKGLYECGGGWQKRRKNLVACNVKSFEILPEYSKGIVSIIKCKLEGEIESEYYTFKRTIAIRNRVLL